MAFTDFISDFAAQNHPQIPNKEAFADAKAMVIKMTGTNELKARANRLLLEWCDTLLGFRVSGTGSPYTDGGLICPACHVIHGRNADLVFPLTLLWDETGDQRYLDAAEKLV